MADDLAASRDALSLAASEWDMLLTSGGVWLGEENHLKQAIRELGELHLWRLAIQLGKLLACATGSQGCTWPALILIKVAAGSQP